MMTTHLFFMYEIENVLYLYNRKCIYLFILLLLSVGLVNAAIKKK